MSRRYILFPYLLLLSFVGGILGLRAGSWYAKQEFVLELKPPLQDFSLYAITLLGVLVGLLTASLSFSRFQRMFSGVERAPFGDKVAGGIGLLFGAIVGTAFVAPFGSLPVGVKAALLVFICIMGVTFAQSMKTEIAGWFGRRPTDAQRADEGDASAPSHQAPPKILDTNVIIDGRIGDICSAGFVEGALVIPQFVLQELQSIADSENSLRRARGRRGLVMLAKMQKELQSRVVVLEDYDVTFDPDEPVDVRLVRIARAMGAQILTNDFNLNKVAELHQVSVLNVNELANALKPVFLPGEDLSVEIVRQGKTAGQGVGYLDDGTMVVVDGGERKIGEAVQCVVTSVLQTVAGKMIFAELGGNGRQRPEGPSHDRGPRSGPRGRGGR